MTTPSPSPKAPLAARILSWLFNTGSPRAVRCWARFFYYLTWLFLRAPRKVAAENLRQAFSGKTPAERKTLLKRNFVYLFELGLDWLHFFVHPERIEERLVRNEELRAHLKANRPAPPEVPGVIFCTPHLGNWELEAHVSFLCGNPGAVVVARFNSKLLNRLAERLRTAGDDTTIIPAEGAARGVLRALHEHRDIGILIDQNVSPKHGGIFLPFFGLPAPTSRLPAAIARRMKVPVYVVATVKRPDGNFEMEYAALPKPAPAYQSDAELTRDILAAFEVLIRRHPEQYLWLYRRWRYIPANAAPAQAAQFPSYAQQKRYSCPEEFLPQA